MNSKHSQNSTFDRGIVFRTWWPLAASWLLMGAELPILSAIVARLADPEVNLAAYGGIVFPLALIIESPVIMLLAASTALSKDWDSYIKIRRFMMITAGIMTFIHVLIAFTPFYYFVVESILNAPDEIIEPARIGMMIMTPWTWSIAYRRFNQGILIRFGHSQTITIGTLIRLSTDTLVLVSGYLIGSIPGIIVAASAVALSVIAEAAYVGVVVKPVINHQLKLEPPVEDTITLSSFLNFYIPLAMTSLLTLLALPIGSAALGRMPLSLASLAVWPVISGLVFMFRSLGVAYNEVVVALLDKVGSSSELKKFALRLAFFTSLALAVMAATPLSDYWFNLVSGLSHQLTQMARIALWLAIPLPAMAAMQSWYQGGLLFGRKTKGITEAVVIYLVSISGILVVGVWWGEVDGLYIAMIAMGISMAVQTGWLWLRSRAIRMSVQIRDDQTIAYPAV
jgi:hypothetical protein